MTQRDTSRGWTPFVVKPYLQLGDNPTRRKSETLSLLWHSPDAHADWVVETQTGRDGAWRVEAVPAARSIVVPTIRAHRVLEATLTHLTPGAPFRYRIRCNGTPVFESQARAPKVPGQAQRFVVFGDCAQGTEGQKRIAYQSSRMDPDYVLITGDIVYSAGRVSEYRERFFPVYNAEAASPNVGAPLLRSTLFVGAPGNHDIANRDLVKNPDGLAYFYYWSQPRNGPIRSAESRYAGTLSGPDERKEAFRDAAGDAFPQAANFSFDYGDVHWTVLDANTYVDWTNPMLRRWVADDLARARHATWRFVAFHHPGFSSSRSHFGEQHMRHLCETFEKGGVSIVFAGHVHNYQRTYPLTFKVRPGQKFRGSIAGTVTMDRDWDGVRRTNANGILYIVSGAGGAKLYDPEQETKPQTLQPFTAKFISTVHSLTVVDLDGARLTLRQIDDQGKEVDRFELTRR